MTPKFIIAPSPVASKPCICGRMAMLESSLCGRPATLSSGLFLFLFALFSLFLWALNVFLRDLGNSIHLFMVPTCGSVLGL